MADEHTSGETPDEAAAETPVPEPDGEDGGESGAADTTEEPTTESVPADPAVTESKPSRPTAKAVGIVAASAVAVAAVVVGAVWAVAAIVSVDDRRVEWGWEATGDDDYRYGVEGDRYGDDDDYRYGDDGDGHGDGGYRYGDDGDGHGDGGDRYGDDGDGHGDDGDRRGDGGDRGRGHSEPGHAERGHSSRPSKPYSERAVPPEDCKRVFSFGLGEDAVTLLLCGDVEGAFDDDDFDFDDFDFDDFDFESWGEGDGFGFDGFALDGDPFGLSRFFDFEDGRRFGRDRDLGDGGRRCPLELAEVPQTLRPDSDLADGGRWCPLRPCYPERLCSCVWTQGPLAERDPLAEGVPFPDDFRFPGVCPPRWYCPLAEGVPFPDDFRFPAGCRLPIVPFGFGESGEYYGFEREEDHDADDGEEPLYEEDSDVPRRRLEPYDLLELSDEARAEMDEIAEVIRELLQEFGLSGSFFGLPEGEGFDFDFDEDESPEEADLPA